MKRTIEGTDFEIKQETLKKIKQHVTKRQLDLIEEDLKVYKKKKIQKNETQKIEKIQKENCQVITAKGDLCKMQTNDNKCWLHTRKFIDVTTENLNFDQDSEYELDNFCVDDSEDEDEVV